jgi:hypothetical protein
MKGGEQHMKKLHIGTICASVFAFSLLFSAPTFADNSSIHDNGTNANNTIEVSQEHQVDIAQQNDPEWAPVFANQYTIVL